MKKLILVTIVIGLISALCSCSMSSKKQAEMPEIFGAELYNASYLVPENLECKHIIPIMSKIKLSDIDDIQVEATGGTYDVQCEIEPGDYQLDNYSWYNIILLFSNVKIQEDVLSINKILIYTNAADKIEIIPDKCDLVSTPEICNVEDIIINGTPLRVPDDMKCFPMEISSEKNITIQDMILTNKDLKIYKYKDYNGKETETFTATEIKKGEPIRTIEICFDIDTSDINKYKEFGTSIIIKYQLNDTVFYAVPGISTTLYNPFNPDFGSIEKYYNEIIKV